MEIWEITNTSKKDYAIDKEKKWKKNQNLIQKNQMCHNFYLLEELRVNVAPILIDEIDEEFFSNKDRENNLIVNVSNLSTSNFDFTPFKKFRQ